MDDPSSAGCCLPFQTYRPLSFGGLCFCRPGSTAHGQICSHQWLPEALLWSLLLVSCGRGNKPRHTEWLATIEIYFLMVLEDRSPKSISTSQSQGVDRTLCPLKVPWKSPFLASSSCHCPIPCLVLLNERPVDRGVCLVPSLSYTLLCSVTMCTDLLLFPSSSPSFWGL